MSSLISGWMTASRLDFPRPKSRRFRNVNRRMSCHVCPSLNKTPVTSKAVWTIHSFDYFVPVTPFLLSLRRVKRIRSGRPDRLSSLNASRMALKELSITTLDARKIIQFKKKMKENLFTCNCPFLDQRRLRIFPTVYTSAGEFLAWGKANSPKLARSWALMFGIEIYLIVVTIMYKTNT